MSEKSEVKKSQVKVIELITWGKDLHRGWNKAPGSKWNFSALHLGDRSKTRGLDLQHLRGDDDELYNRFVNDEDFKKTVNLCFQKVKELVANGDCVFSINCAKGRHRSRALARGLGELIVKELHIPVRLTYYDK